MRRYIVLLFAVFSISGCSKNIPAPLGDELVYSSNGKESRPEWCFKPNVALENKFVGQSLFHATERSAIRNAELDASRQILLSENQFVTAEQSEKMYAENSERLILSANTNTRSQVKQFGEAQLNGIEIREIYLEKWRVGEDFLWKAFVLVEQRKS